MSRLPVPVVAAVLAVPGIAAADDAPPSVLAEAIEVVARAETSAATATPRVTVLGPADLARRQAGSVAEILDEVPGALVLPDGPRGQTSRLFLRGAASNQTLVVVDGVPQNDATAGGFFDFGDLSAAAVERIEVLSGSYGVLYGSEAVGGVVSVSTRRGRGAWRGFVSAEGGSFTSHRESAGFGGGDDDFDLALTVADDGSRGERRREAFAAQEFAGRAGFRIAPAFRADLALRAAGSRVESPFDFPGFGATVLPTDRNVERTRDTLSTALTLTHDPCEALVTRLTLSYLRVESLFENGSDGARRADPDGTPGSGDEFVDDRDELVADSRAADRRIRLATTVGVSRLAGWRDRRDGGVEIDVTAGAEALEQGSRSVAASPNFGGPRMSVTTTDRDLGTVSAFALAEARLPDLGPVRGGALAAGVRRDRHETFGGETSPCAGLRFAVAPTDTTVRASWGEGFRAPKPGELDDPFVGDPDLGPETSRSLDANVSQAFLGGRAEVGVTAFRLDTEGMIAFDPSATSPSRPFGSLVNFQDTRTTGVEWDARGDLGGGFALRAAYTRQNPRDRGTGLPLPNRSRDFVSAGISWERGAFLVSLDGVVTSKFPAQGGEYAVPEPDERRAPGRRALVNLTARWQAAEGVTVFARVENLLDDDWVATPTSPAGPPLGVFAGVRFDF